MGLIENAIISISKEYDVSYEIAALIYTYKDIIIAIESGQFDKTTLTYKQWFSKSYAEHLKKMLEKCKI